MRLAHLTAATLALLPSTALVAQETTPLNVDSVYVDVGGTAVLVPLEVAVEACGTDMDTLRQTARTAVQAQGLDPAMVYGTDATAAAGAAAADAGGAALPDATESAEASGEAPAAEAGGTDTATADAATADAGTADAGTADAEGTGDVRNVENTAAEPGAGSLTNEQLATVSVCQIDQARGAELGIDAVAGSTTGAATE